MGVQEPSAAALGAPAGGPLPRAWAPTPSGGEKEPRVLSREKTWSEGARTFLIVDGSQPFPLRLTLSSLLLPQTYCR